MDGLTSTAAKTLLPLAKAVAQKVSQLRAERAAAREPLQVQTGIMDKKLKETLGRFRGSTVDDAWWRRVLSEMEQAYVAPEFFRKPTVRRWLGEERVQDGLVSLAGPRILGQLAEGEDEVRERLSEAYSEHTGEAARFAEEPIDVTVAALTAGYIESIPKDQRSLAGMSQATYGRLDGIENKLDRALAGNAVVQSIHGKVAEEELSTILSLRMFDFSEAIGRVAELWRRVDSGDLAAVPKAVKTRVCYWAARLHATRPETVGEARSMRRNLSERDTNENVQLVDALIKATDGDFDGALRMLREGDDADARSAVLGLIVRSRGEETALDWCADVRPDQSPTYFTAIGWRLWAVCLGRIGKWTEAADGLKALSSTSDWDAGLAMIEGVINGAQLIPEELRKLAFEGVPTYAGMAPNLGREAKSIHARARECFLRVAQCLRELRVKGLSEFVADWCTWVELMDPLAARADVARSKVRERIETGHMSAGLVSLAWGFEIQFDPELLRERLKGNERLGGLGDAERLAECLLNQRSMNAGEFAEYVERQMESLDKVMTKSMTTSMLFQALLEDGQVARARAMVERRREQLDQTLAARMDAALALEAGTDPRESLEAVYRQSDDLVDLKNVISHLVTVRDREALRPLLLTLFEREPKLEHAFEVVHWLGQPPADHGGILAFLEAHPLLVQQNNDMKSAMAWALFGVGRVAESRAINDELLADRHHPNDLVLDSSIAVATGDWESLPAIVNRAWAHRNELEAEMLMMLAHLTSRAGESAERVIALARLAADKAPDDPHLLVAAYGIHFELGRDADADPTWLTRALANSSAEGGPIWQTDLRQMVNDWLPQARDHRQRIDRMLMEGKLPLALAAGALNTPLSRILLGGQSENVRDGRRRAFVPIVSGARNRLDFTKDLTLGLDLTSIMVLARLGLLDTTLESVDHVKVAAETMACLFAERATVRFHQPARVDAARDVRRVIDQGLVELIDGAESPPADLVEEVGVELASLLEAREGGSVVVCVRPIHKAQSLREEAADTSAYDDFIVSPADLCALAHRDGLTDADQHQRAEAFLATQGQTVGKGLSRSMLCGPIFVHSLALSYLQSAQVLDLIANGSMDLRVHPSVADEMNALIDAGDAGEELADAVEGIRDSLRAGMQSGKVTLLPQQPERDRHIRSPETADSLAGLLFGSADCDALCVDDRYVNSHATSEGPTGKAVPVVCVLDVLRHLRAGRFISEESYWGARHKLRQAGFAFVPLEARELLRQLSTAEFEDGRMLESAELKVIRQTVNRIDTLDLLSEGEARALSDGTVLVCSEAIRRIWLDTTLEAPVAKALCSWVWRYLGVATFLLRRDPEEDGGFATFRDGVVRRLSLLMLPPIVDSTDRRAAYREWLDGSVLADFRPANGDLVEEAAKGIHMTIGGVDDPERLVAALFLECLPDALREQTAFADPALAEACGFASKSVVLVGGILGIAEVDLLDAAAAVYAGTQTAQLSDTEGTSAELTRADDKETLVVSWIDAAGKACRVQVPELTLLSGSGEARMRALDEIVRHLGPTAQETRALLEPASSRPLTPDEVSALWGEMTTGVAPIQSRLASKIAQGWRTTLVDVVPPSIAYWERFCGPVPNGPDPETYFREQLIPYRKGLIDADAEAGFDIACLGSMRDDLCPGTWLDGNDDETVWNALMSMPMQGNPIVLLAALDAALYRAGDERFRRFAEDCVGMLLDDHLGLSEDCDVYRLFEVLADFEMHRLGLTEGIGRCPGFWRRMCAWMQAGLIVRMAIGCSAVPEAGKLEESCKQHMVPAGTLRQLVDCQAEPLVLGHMLLPGHLRHEVLVRLAGLKERHEKAGRVVPMAEEIESARSRMGQSQDRSKLVSMSPGPAASHLRPNDPMPSSIANTLSQTWVEQPVEALALTAHLSQFFVLGDDYSARVRRMVESTAEPARYNDFGDEVGRLHVASIVAAATRDTALAESIGAAVGRLSCGISRPDDVELVLRVLLQAAAAHADEQAWSGWLATHLANLAERLPTDSRECVQWLWYLLDRMEVALPIHSWFHLRAKRIVGMALDTVP